MALPIVLLTGGSGFIASHILDELLKRKYSVVVTVRSQAKGQKLVRAYPASVQEQLDFTVVEDVAADEAFVDAVKLRSFTYIIHTACPYHFNVTDPIKDFIDPAVNGTTGVLRAARDHAPTVERIVLTSSSATILNPFNHSEVYDETVWGETTWEQAMDPRLAYRASKIFAEKAAWDFMATEGPTFDLVILNPPLVFGPTPRHLSNLNTQLNTSNHQIRDIIQGKYSSSPLPPTGPVYLFADVRDVAEAHIRAMEVPEAGGQRFFTVGGYFSNKRVVDVIRASHPELDANDKLPAREALVDDMPEKVYGFDNSKSSTVLGISFRDLSSCVRDTVDSMSRISQD